MPDLQIEQNRYQGVNFDQFSNRKSKQPTSARFPRQKNLVKQNNITLIFTTLKGEESMSPFLYPPISTFFRRAIQWLIAASLIVTPLGAIPLSNVAAYNDDIENNHQQAKADDDIPVNCTPIRRSNNVYNQLVAIGRSKGLKGSPSNIQIIITQCNSKVTVENFFNRHISPETANRLLEKARSAPLGPWEFIPNKNLIVVELNKGGVGLQYQTSAETMPEGDLGDKIDDGPCGGWRGFISWLFGR